MLYLKQESQWTTIIIIIIIIILQYNYKIFFQQKKLHQNTKIQGVLIQVSVPCGVEGGIFD